MSRDAVARRSLGVLAGLVLFSAACSVLFPFSPTPRGVDAGGDADADGDGDGDGDADAGAGAPCDTADDCHEGLDACEVATCDDGHCARAPRDCADEVLCTRDTCIGGECIHEVVPELCTDPNAPYCDAVRGCVAARECATVDDCSPSFCAPERCVEEVCVQDPPPCADDGASCTTAVCNELARRCEVASSDAACEDQNPCTNDRCDPANGGEAGTGCVHSAVTCDDGWACTVDSCSPADGCRFTPDAGRCSPDGDPCTYQPSCSPGAGGADADGCVWSFRTCEDQHFCTDDACDGIGGCTFLPNDLHCDDEDPNTADLCDPPRGDVLGCTHTIDCALLCEGEAAGDCSLVHCGYFATAFDCELACALWAAPLLTCVDFVATHDSQCTDYRDTCSLPDPGVALGWCQ